MSESANISHLGSKTRTHSPNIEKAVSKKKTSNYDRCIVQIFNLDRDSRSIKDINKSLRVLAYHEKAQLTRVIILEAFLSYAPF